MSRENAVLSHTVLLEVNVIYVVNLLVYFNFLIQFIYIEAMKLENRCHLFMCIFASLKMARKKCLHGKRAMVSDNHPAILNLLIHIVL